jgi:O-antigen ligase
MAAAICLAFLIDLDSGRLALQLLGRITGDYSSQERLELLKHGLAAFMDAPFLGKGYRYVELTAGQSTHSELVEILANFGLAGLVAIGLASYLLYRGGSARFLLVCVAPTFLFSHNFFETVSFQAALGLALAADRSRGAATAVDEGG